jgi:hypothetical protein
MIMWLTESFSEFLEPNQVCTHFASALATFNIRVSFLAAHCAAPWLNQPQYRPLTSWYLFLCSFRRYLAFACAEIHCCRSWTSGNCSGWSYDIIFPQFGDFVEWVNLISPPIAITAISSWPGQIWLFHLRCSVTNGASYSHSSAYWKEAFNSTETPILRMFW